MELHVESEKLIDGTLFYRLRAPALNGHCKLSKLCTPVADVIHTDRIVTQMLIEIGNSLTNDRRHDVMNPQWLCDIGLRILHNHRCFLLPLHASCACFTCLCELCQKCLRGKPHIHVTCSPHVNAFDY